MSVCCHFNPISTLVLKNKDVLFALKIDIRLQKLGTSCDPGSPFWGIGWGVGLVGGWRGKKRHWWLLSQGSRRGSEYVSICTLAGACLEVYYQEPSGAFALQVSSEKKGCLPLVPSQCLLKPVASASSDLPLGSFPSKSFSLSLPESGPGIFTFWLLEWNERVSFCRGRFVLYRAAFDGSDFPQQI